MGVEVAFLLGVLVGQWITFLAMWRRVAVLSQSIAYLAAEFHREAQHGEAVIDLSLDEYRDHDLF